MQKLILVCCFLIPAFSFAQQGTKVVTGDKSVEIAAEKKKKKVIVKVGMVGESNVGKTSLMVKYVEGYYFEPSAEGHRLQITEYHPAWKDRSLLKEYVALPTDFEGMIIEEIPLLNVRFRCVSGERVMPCSTRASREFETTQWLGCYGADCVIEIFSAE